MELQSKNTALLFKVAHSKPIEMSDFVATMNALGSLFGSFVKEHADSCEGRKAKLYVEKIEHGCIEFYLTEFITACALPFIENFNAIYEFASSLRMLVNRAISGDSETRLSVAELRSLRDIFAITSNDAGGETTFGPVDRSAPAIILHNCSCTFNFTDSNTAQNVISKAIEERERETPREILHEKQLMTIFQTRSDMDTHKGNRAKIDALFPKDLSVYFDSEELKHRMLASIGNPARQAYVVDVVMQTVEGKPVSYKVMNLHEIIQL